jgi:S-adenosylmethionine decarboxylase
MMSGVEWLIETFRCAEPRLKDVDSLSRLFDDIVRSMRLSPVGSPVWHRFPDDGGITGIWLLQESHIAIHTFPEHRSACLNVFCCKARQPMAWAAALEARIGAEETRVRECRRDYGQFS